jgi:hypothetical protein
VMLEAYGTCELVRTGRIALGRGADVITDEPPVLTSVPERAESAA